MNRVEAEVLAERIRSDREAHVDVLGVYQHGLNAEMYYVLCCYANGGVFVVMSNQMWIERRMFNLSTSRINFDQQKMRREI